jgi:hypothetical protein
VVGARYELSAVHAAAREERVELDERRARDELLRFFKTMLECYPFAAAVLLELQSEDWSETIMLEDPPHGGSYDIYGVRISDSLLSRYPKVAREWYVKLRLTASWTGETVFLVSIHPLEFSLRRAGGELKPGGTP